MSLRCVVDSFNHIPFFVSKWVSKQKHENYIVVVAKDTEGIRDGLPPRLLKLNLHRIEI